MRLERAIGTTYYSITSGALPVLELFPKMPRATSIREIVPTAVEETSPLSDVFVTTRLPDPRGLDVDTTSPRSLGGSTQGHL